MLKRMRMAVWSIVVFIMMFQVIGLGPNAAKVYASNPSPLSDPGNSQGWVFMDEFSDEFDDGSLDLSKWEKLPISWRDEWLWDDNQTVESNGNLNLSMDYEVTNKHNQTVKNWNTVVFIDGKSQQADFVTTEQHRSGESALVHQFYYPYYVQTEQTLTNLTNGTYTFSAYVWSGGTTQEIVRMSVKEYGGVDLYQTIPTQNGGYTQYTISDIPVTSGEVTIAFESKAPADSWIRVDDVSFSNNSTTQTNLVLNPGFESRNNVYYKSGGIKSMDTIKYGYFEARIDGSTPIPGTSPAFWLKAIDDNYGNEIDVIEFGQAPSDIHRLDMNLHNYKKPNYVSHWNTAGHYTASYDPSAGYHTFGLDWGPGYQRWYIDGVLRRSTNYEIYDQIAMEIYASLGLRYPYTDNPTSTGFPGDSAKFDYVRVWKHGSISINNTAIGTTEEQFNYTGNWTHKSQLHAYQGDESQSSTANDYYEVKFYGKGIDVYSSKGPSQGIAAYSVDGGAETLIDHYDSVHDDQLLVWSSPELAVGMHTLKVRVTGTKNSSASDYKLNADRVDVRNQSGGGGGTTFPDPNKFYYLKAVGVSNSLGADLRAYGEGAGATPAYNVRVGTGSSDAYKWKFIPSGNDYMLENKANTGYYLWGRGTGATPQYNVEQTNQISDWTKWNLVQAGTHYYLESVGLNDSSGMTYRLFGRGMGSSPVQNVEVGTGLTDFYKWEIIEAN